MTKGEAGIPSQRGCFKKLVLKTSLTKRGHPVFSSVPWFTNEMAGACGSTPLPASPNSFAVLVMLDSDIKIQYDNYWD
ncbi:hypothetical protein ACO0LD_29765 [Undibacterium sp. Ji83W]|uniref:hypothetical protein n=1 Tax=Undibacterium sp. Ji83W TaxID=3413043 RepID=UPI003BF31E99